MIAQAGGAFTLKIRHERRECGCYSLGASDDAMWGWFYKDVLTHEIETTVAPFAIRESLVTNAEYVAFVRASGYWPADAARFLEHLPGLVVPPELADHPVTFVSLDDARAFAAWEGHRLPTEAEWQLAGLSSSPWELTESEHFDGHTRFVLLRGGSPLPERNSEWLPERGARPIDSHAKYILIFDGLDRAETISFRTVRG
jgi:formylglycine-generating enzyme required for sulfatase activity